MKFGHLDGTSLRDDGGWYPFPRIAVPGVEPERYRSVSSVLDVVGGENLRDWMAAEERKMWAGRWEEYKRDPSYKAMAALDADFKKSGKELPFAGIAYRDLKGAYGTEAHHALDNLDLHGTWECETKEARLYVESALSWMKGFPHTTLGLSAPVYNRQLGYAGTMDKLIQLPDGGVYVLDWKTSNRLSDKHRMQVAAYVFAPEVWLRDDKLHLWSEFGITIQGGILVHLQSNGSPAKMEIVDVKKHFDVFVAICDVSWRILRARGVGVYDGD